MNRHLRHEHLHRIQGEVLEDLASAVNYNRWLADLCEPWLGDDVLELGAGAGTYSDLWSRTGRTVTATDAASPRVEELGRRFAAADNVAVAEVTLPLVDVVEQLGRDAPFSSAVAVNVIEHVRADTAAVSSMATVVRPGGYLVVLVPAFDWAMSEFDRDVGHFRRYRRAEVAGLLNRAGLVEVNAHYVNSMGLPAWWLRMRVMGKRPQEGPLLQLFDRAFVPVLRRVEAVRRPPFGQSVLGVGRVPGPDSGG